MFWDMVNIDYILNNVIICNIWFTIGLIPSIFVRNWWSSLAFIEKFDPTWMYCFQTNLYSMFLLSFHILNTLVVFHMWSWYNSIIYILTIICLAKNENKIYGNIFILLFWAKSVSFNVIMFIIISLKFFGGH